MAIATWSWPGLSRPSRYWQHRANVIEIAGTSPAMTNQLPRVLPLLPQFAGGQFVGGCGTCIVIRTIGAPPVGMTWCGVLAGTMSISPLTTA